MTVVIINPVSGPARRGGASERVAVARRVLDAGGGSYRIEVTEGANHAADLAAAAAASGATLVIAWGGDGTINEVGRAIAFTDAALGLVPGGSGNGFARELNVPFDAGAALRHALSAEARRVDAGEIGGRMFFNVSGIGLDAEVARDVTTAVHRRGLWPYLLASSRELFRYAPRDYTIDTDAGRIQSTALTVTLANSRQYGYAARIAPLASIEDGRLDLVVVENRSMAGNLLRVPALFTGGFHLRRGVKNLKVREVRISSSGPMLFHVDGEVIEGGRELSARVHAGALRVRA